LAVITLIAIVAAASLLAACGTIASAAASPPPGAAVASPTATPAADVHSNVIAFIKHQKLYTIRTDGKGLKLIARDVASAAWSPDGSRLAYIPARHYGLYVVNADGSDPHKIAAGGGGMAWSPDGSRIVYRKGIGWGYLSQLVIVNADGSGEGGRTLPLTPGTYSDGNPAWAPDGRIFFGREDPRSGIGEIDSINPDGSGLETVTAAGRFAEFSLSPDGKWLLLWDRRSGGFARMLASGRGGEYVVLGWFHGRLKSMATDPTPAHSSWSPDGSKIVFAYMPRWQPQLHRLVSGWPGHAWAVYVMGLDGAALHKVPNTERGSEPIWRP
jgi:Tol biopolymer transport system component